MEKARSASGVGGLEAEEQWSADSRDLVPRPGHSPAWRGQLERTGEEEATEPQGRPGSHGVLGILRADEVPTFSGRWKGVGCI